jgi:tetratricopeptide (TPR) repeat protein
VARADRRRAARTKPLAASSRYESAYVGTEELFFQRLRRQAKWAFVFLALVFAVGFVVFGVGSDVPGGVADIIGQGGAGNSGQPSVEEAREKLAEDPDNPQALRDLATALQNEGKPEEAIAPLETYTSLRRRDEEGFRELAGLYLTKATRLRNSLQAAQAEAAALNPGDPFRPPQTSPFGQALTAGPVVEAASARATSRINELLGELQATYDSAKRAYQAIVRITPEDAAVQLELADAALNSGDTATAISAYKRFLRLAPDDPTAPLVRQQLRRLEGVAVTPRP